MTNEPNVRHEIAMAQDALVRASRNKKKDKPIAEARSWLSLAQNKIHEIVKVEVRHLRLREELIMRSK